ncbi:MAG: four-carbon acid sugar kinase family protein [Anaerolineaceae bacterium]|nr:MAG: four-carbon acid sugar kinase family protein [Anaerolineaceae bacterium]
MIKLLILADDITGALDTGVQFANKGIETKVVTDIEYDFADINKTTEVLVIDTETRPLSKQKAYEIVHRIVKRAENAGISSIYKKTDSALRGNVGSELTALLDASNRDSLFFIPAFPKANRITKSGTHYLGETPIHETSFGKDLFEPVTTSYVPDIIGLQSEANVISVSKETDINLLKNNQDKQIVVFDAETEDDIKIISKLLRDNDKLHIIAGCAGFASYLPDLLSLTRNKKHLAKKTQGICVICGSLNDITKRQVDYAVEKGFKHVNLKFKQIYTNNYFETNQGKDCLKEIINMFKKNKILIIDTFNRQETEGNEQFNYINSTNKAEVRNTIASNLGTIAKKFVENELDCTFLMTGGDTLMGFMKQVNCSFLYPICEIEQGVVLSYIYLNNTRVQIVSKSGGFGNKDVFVNIVNKLMYQ